MGGNAGVIEDDDIIKNPLLCFGLLQKTKCLTVTLEKRLEVNIIINVFSVHQSAQRKDARSSGRLQQEAECCCFN